MYIWVMCTYHTTSYSIVLCSVFMLLMTSGTLRAVNHQTWCTSAHVHLVYYNYNNIYLYEFLSQFYLLSPWTVVHGSKGKFEGKRKEQNLRNPMPLS